jgi:hypothetical protein
VAVRADHDLWSERLTRGENHLNVSGADSQRLNAHAALHNSVGQFTPEPIEKIRSGDGSDRMAEPIGHDPQIKVQQSSPVGSEQHEVVNPAAETLEFDCTALQSQGTIAENGDGGTTDGRVLQALDNFDLVTALAQGAGCSKAARTSPDDQDVHACPSPFGHNRLVDHRD